MNLEDVIKDVQTRPTVPLWPHIGLLFNLSRTSVYKAARRNEIETVRINGTIRAVSAAIRQRLKIDAA